MLRQQVELNARIRDEYARVKSYPSAKYYTYTLMLQNSHVYVGNTDNIFQRLADHFGMTPQCSQWVREHGPVVRVVEIIRDSHPNDEMYKTLEWCDIMGHDKVRGGTYCRVRSSNPPTALEEFVREPERRFDYLTRYEIDAIASMARRFASHT